MFKKYSVHTCFCDGMLSEGKLWDDLLRGGGCGGASRFDGEAVGDIAVIGISGSCIFTIEVGWTGTAPCGLSGSGSIGDPINTFNYFLSSNTKMFLIMIVIIVVMPNPVWTTGWLCNRP